MIRRRFAPALQIGEGTGHGMALIDLVGTGDEIEAGADDLAVVEDRLARLVEFAPKSVGVGRGRDALHCSVGADAADGVG